VRGMRTKQPWKKGKSMEKKKKRGPHAASKRASPFDEKDYFQPTLPRVTAPEPLKVQRTNQRMKNERASSGRPNKKPNEEKPPFCWRRGLGCREFPIVFLRAQKNEKRASRKKEKKGAVEEKNISVARKLH